MSRAQVVAILLAAPLTTLIAQQDAGTHLTIQITDETGAPIPHAKVEIMSPEDGKLLEFAADSQGVADLHLNRRDYQYRVSYPAFCPKNGNFTVDQVWPPMLTAKLNVDTCPGPCHHFCVTPIRVEPDTPDIPVYTPQPPLIPLIQIQNLAVPGTAPFQK